MKYFFILLLGLVACAPTVRTPAYVDAPVVENVIVTATINDEPVEVTVVEDSGIDRITAEEGWQVSGTNYDARLFLLRSVGSPSSFFIVENKGSEPLPVHMSKAAQVKDRVMEALTDVSGNDLEDYEVLPDTIGFSVLNRKIQKYLGMGSTFIDFTEETLAEESGEIISFSFQVGDDNILYTLSMR